MSRWLDLSYSRIDAAWAARRAAEGYQGLIQCAVALPYSGPDPIEHAGDNLRAAREGGLATMVYVVYGDALQTGRVTDHALRVCGGEINGAFIWADFETNVPDGPDLIVSAMNSIYEMQLDAGIYTNLDWWSRHLGARNDFAGTPLWQALWDNNPDWRAVYQLDGLTTVGKQFAGGQIEGVEVDVSSFSDQWLQSIGVGAGASARPKGDDMARLIILPDGSIWEVLLNMRRHIADPGDFEAQRFNWTDPVPVTHEEAASIPVFEDVIREQVAAAIDGKNITVSLDAHAIAVAVADELSLRLQS